MRRVAHKAWAQCRLARENAEFGVFWEHRANFFVHEARQHGDIETNNTTAHPKQGTAETGITSAPEKCTKNTHFAPAKAMVVSTPYRFQQAKAMAVSVEARSAPQRRWWFQTGPPGRQGQTAVPMGGGRAWPGFETTRRTARQHTRHRGCGGHRRDLPRCRWAAAGPGRASTQRTEPHVSTPNAAGVEGAGGSGGHGRASRSTTPSRRLACGDLAGGRARRRPEHQRSHKQQHTARTASGRAAAHRHTQRPGPPAPGTPVGPQQNEAATGFPATASSRSRSAVHNSTASDQAVMST